MPQLLLWSRLGLELNQLLLLFSVACNAASISRDTPISESSLQSVRLTNGGTLKGTGSQRLLIVGLEACDAVSSITYKPLNSLAVHTIDSNHELPIFADELIVGGGSGEVVVHYYAITAV